jgi:hypothetical protein
VNLIKKFGVRSIAEVVRIAQSGIS